MALWIVLPLGVVIGYLLGAANTHVDEKGEPRLSAHIWAYGFLIAFVLAEAAGAGVGTRMIEQESVEMRQVGLDERLSAYRGMQSSMILSIPVGVGILAVVHLLRQKKRPQLFLELKWNEEQRGKYGGAVAALVIFASMWCYNG